MIIGYGDGAGFLYCTTCWAKQVEDGSRPESVLTDDREEPEDHFWLADKCEDSGRQLKYMTIRMLD